MYQETTGTVIAVSRQWWLKINTKPVRKYSTDGAIFPYIIKVAYTVNGRQYVARKWIPAGTPVPQAGSSVAVLYDGNRPGKAKIF